MTQEAKQTWKPKTDAEWDVTEGLTIFGRYFVSKDNRHSQRKRDVIHRMKDLGLIVFKNSTDRFQEWELTEKGRMEVPQ